MTTLRRIILAACATLMLAGCNSTSDGLFAAGGPKPSQPVGSEDVQPDPATAPAPSEPETALAPSQSAPEPAGQTQIAAVTTNARVQFAPVVGATAKAVAPLSRRLALRAAERGIKLSGRSDSQTTHVMKGYFSAISEAGQTTVIYVWDVLDPSGNRLHRIQGQSKAGGGNGDAWSSVSDVTMETIADNTIQSLAKWLDSQKT